MKTLLLIWSLVIGHCIAGPFFFGQQGVLATSSAPISGYTPADYGSVAVKWWLAARKESFANNDPVGTFTDRSTSAINATQSTSSKKPTFKTSVVNGHPAVLGDGVDDVMDLASNPASGASAVTVMWVCKMAADPAAGSGSSACLLGRFGSSGQSDHMTWTDGTTYLGLFSTTRPMSQNLSADVSQWHLYTAIVKSGGWTFRVDGTQVFTTASNTVGLGAAPTLFADTRSGLWYGSGHLAEVVIWNGELTGTDLTTEENGLKAEYGL